LAKGIKKNGKILAIPTKNLQQHPSEGKSSDRGCIAKYKAQGGEGKEGMIAVIAEKTSNASFGQKKIAAKTFH